MTAALDALARLAHAVAAAWWFLTIWLGLGVQVLVGWVLVMSRAERLQWDRLARWGPWGTRPRPRRGR